ncbi:LON peptidase N-terminal domain and RING finger protein 2-like [Daktulosphaira vitifoliae]|uniref:LON peptidase N-terminal domain and RING finger protein 2-like n=1 Tax=Daktulosphaira vitifoliae TaxID=58002 RepID=UPI0021A993A4|nr:LON peptidase N-terminal domain and RING finger protein 2-like [Daktulosphaira vitifoliae]
MAEVATNENFTGLYISTYGSGGSGGVDGVVQPTAVADAVCKIGSSVIGHQHGFMAHRSLDAYVKYAELLAKCGKVSESLELYVRCFQLDSLPAEFLWQVSAAFVDLIRKQQLLINNGDESRAPESKKIINGPFTCGVCDMVLREPVTLHCGHTFCRRCVAGPGKPLCIRCGQRTAFQPHVNVLVKSFVEKLWCDQLRAAELLDEGKVLYSQEKLHSALLKFNKSFYTGGENYDLLNIRSRTQLKLGFKGDALLDANRVVQMRPKWCKGHFTRGIVLHSTENYQEALFEFSLSIILGENVQKVIPHIVEVLQRLLLIYSKETDVSNLENWNLITHFTYLNTFMVESDQFKSLPNVLFKKNSQNNSDTKEFDVTNSITSLIQRIMDGITNFKQSLLNVKNCRELFVNKSLLEESDFNCVLCCGMLKNPVTTPCGHTYCMDCLEHNFDYSFHCPLCLTALPPSLALSKKNNTEFVDELLNLKFFMYGLMRMSNWKKEIDQDNAYLPVFVCTNAFPSVSCPLHVFEPRYRLMIRRCIESGSRRFAMISHCRPPMKFAEYGTVLEIKDRLVMGNGCSFLSTIGTRRFKVLVRKEHDGYDMAKVQIIQDKEVPENKLKEVRQMHDNVRQRGLKWFNGFREEIKSEILRTVGFPPAVESNWEQLVDGPAWTWWLLSLLPLGANVHVDLLANTSIEVRLKVINKILSRIEQSSLSRRITSSD